MQQTTITLKVCDKTKEQMIDFFEDLKREKTPPYAIFQAQDGDTVVTLYESGKVVFQGKDADLSSDFWIATEKLNSGTASTTDSRDKKKEDKQNNTLSRYHPCICAGCGLICNIVQHGQRDNKSERAYVLRNSTYVHCGYSLHRMDW